MNNQAEQETRPALENIVSSSVPSMVTLACPIEGCGKTFERPTEDEAFNAVKMHALPAHKIKLTRADLGLAPKERVEKPTRVRETPRVKTEEVLPDEYNYLLETLTEFGVSRGKPICDLMSRLSWDAYDALADYLELSGVRRDRIALVLESWSQHRGTQIPKEVSEKLKVPQYTRQYDRYGFRRRGYGAEEDIDTLIDRQIQRKTKLSMLKGLEEPRPTDETGSNLLHELTYKMGQIEERMKQPAQPVVVDNSALQQRVEDLSKKLDEEKEKRLFDKIDTLTKEVQEVKNKAMSAESAYGVLNTTIVSVKELAQEYFGFAKAVATGRFNPEKTPKRKKIERPEGAPTIEEMVREVEPDLVE